MYGNIINEAFGKVTAKSLNVFITQIKCNAYAVLQISMKRLSLIFGCKKGCKSRNYLIYTLYCGEGGILPAHLPATFRSHLAAKFSMQIVNNAMHIVCIPAGHFRCIHHFRTVGDSNPTLIINHFRGENRACLRMFKDSLRANNSVLILL